MSIESTLFATLDNDATLTGLLASRIYPGVAPDNADYPYITYQSITGEAHNRIAGAANTDRKVVQVNCWSKSYSASKEVADAVRDAIVGVGYTDPDFHTYFQQTQSHRVYVDVSLIG